MVAALLLISICWNSATLERVIDGDTYVLRVELGFDAIARVTIRLQGIDTPERFTPEGKAAKEAIEMRFRECPIEVQPTGDRTFARWVAHVRACGEDVASWLRAAGHEVTVIQFQAGGGYGVFQGQGDRESDQRRYSEPDRRRADRENHPRARRR